MKSLAEMADEVFTWAEGKGWEPSKDTFGDSCALLHSEVSEALEAFRINGIIPFYEVEGNILKSAYFQQYGDNKPEGVPSEFADVLIRLLHYCKRYGVDLEAEYEAKMAYNQKRPYRHGGKAL
jgi:NTP pyrophosphatase (non-canonical NTP hydrolase)